MGSSIVVGEWPSGHGRITLARIVRRGSWGTFGAPLRLRLDLPTRETGTFPRYHPPNTPLETHS